VTVGGADLSFRRAKDGTVSTLFSKARKNNEGRWRDEEFKLQEQFSGLTTMSVWPESLNQAGPMIKAIWIDEPNTDLG